MGKVDRLCNRVVPFAVLFWALGIVLANTANTGLCPPARHHSTAVHKACPYMVIVGSILNEDAFSSLGILHVFIYEWRSLPGHFLFENPVFDEGYGGFLHYIRINIQTSL